jgi:hypothetical protein
VILLGTDLNRMVATGQIDKNRPLLQDQETFDALSLKLNTAATSTNL